MILIINEVYCFSTGNPGIQQIQYIQVENKQLYF